MVAAVVGAAAAVAVADISRATLAVRPPRHRNIAHRPFAMTTTAVAGMSPTALDTRAGAGMVGREVVIAEIDCQGDQLS